MAQVLGSLPSTWKTQMQFLTPRFGPAQAQLWEHLGIEPVGARSLFLPLSYPLSNKVKIINKILKI